MYWPEKQFARKEESTNKNGVGEAGKGELQQKSEKFGHPETMLLLS